MTKIEEIYAAVLPELEKNGFEDTTESRFYALQGLRDAWNEDPDTSLEKTLYQMALNVELMTLGLKLKYPDIHK